MVVLRVAFASTAHAAEGLAFIKRAAVPFRLTAPSRGGSGGECVQLELEVAPDDAGRLQTLVLGVHGVITGGATAGH